MLLDMLVIGRNGFAIFLSHWRSCASRNFSINACSSVADRLIFEARAASSRSRRILTCVAIFGRARVREVMARSGAGPSRYCTVYKNKNLRSQATYPLLVDAQVDLLNELQARLVFRSRKLRRGVRKSARRSRAQVSYLL